MKTLLKGVLNLGAGLLIPACIGERDRDETPWETTTDGFIVYWYDEGTLSTGLSDKATLYAEFDAAMQLAADQMFTQYGTPREDFFAAARLHKFRLHDNIFFDYNGQRVFGYHKDASDFNEVGAAYWPYRKDPNGVDQTSPPWTWYHSAVDGYWYWGVHDVAALFAVLKHEVGHHLKGPTFEHKAGPFKEFCPGCRVDF